MSSTRGVLTALSLATIAGAGVALFRASSPEVADARAPEGTIDRREVSGPPPRPEPAPPTVDPQQLADRLADARWLAIGGGAWPDSTQVQIEQDVGLAAEVLGEGGVVLFGAGPGAAVVQVQRTMPGDPLVTALGDLFAPRGGRDAMYRAPTIGVDAEATADGVLAALGTATASGPDPLLVFIAGHGDIGATARENSISLWADSRIHVDDLAERLDDAKRPVRLVVTTCFSGGFAELGFRAADPAAGAAGDRCGLFASTWDLEASGCDPNPDRGAQQGYAIHFLNALRARDRSGAPLAVAELDLDGDGVVGLLDAHTRVRIASDGADVPTTTSERWLREHAPTDGDEIEIAVPEEDAVVAALGPRLGLDGQAATARLATIEAEIAAVQADVERLGALEDAAFRLAAAELLARWPVLDDPWHPEHATLVRSQRSAIEDHLRSSTRYAAYLEAREATALAHGRRADLGAAAAPIERLARAAENRVLSRRLAAKGGAAFDTWRRLRACERWSPPPTTTSPR